MVLQAVLTTMIVSQGRRNALFIPHFLFELCVSGRMIEPTPVFMRLREQNEFYGGSTQWVRNKISPFSSRLIRLCKVDFQGSRVTSDSGLLLVRELDERL